MVTAPSMKNIISLTSADARVSSETATPMEGAWTRKSSSQEILHKVINNENAHKQLHLSKYNDKLLITNSTQSMTIPMRLTKCLILLQVITLFFRSNQSIINCKQISVKIIFFW